MGSIIKHNKKLQTDQVLKNIKDEKGLLRKRKDLLLDGD